LADGARIGTRMNFYAALAAYYDDIFPRDPAIVEFLRTEFRDKRRLIDAACGTGTYALALAEAGHPVLGIDSDSAMIREARRKEAARPMTGGSPFARVEFVVGDMADPSAVPAGAVPEAEYDGLFCIGNSLPHLSGKASAGKAVAVLAEKLGPSSSAVIQVVNFRSVLNKGGSLPALENERVRFKRSYRKRDGESVWFETELLIKDENASFSNRIPLLAMDREDLAAFLAAAGFGRVSFYGSFGRAAFDPETSFLIIAAAEKG
jgi:glycine/sarcosine N-methyltransferase